MKSYMPTKIYTGENIINNNSNLFKLGKKCLIITSGTSSKKSGALDDVINVLNIDSIEYEILDSIKQNPTVKSCIEAGEKAYESNADFIIGIGGGSPLDAAKTASVVANNHGLSEDDIYAFAWTNKPLPLILIGTTAGTGSEVTNVSVMTNCKGNKKSIHHDDLYAKYAFGDPRYTLSMPKYIQISTAIDALAHLTESYFNNNANDISKSYSLQGIRILFPYLELLSSNNELTISQREDVYNASILGGLAINITGTTFCHALGYYFTENFNLPHGFACAIFMNHLIDFEHKNNLEYTNNFFSALNINIDNFKNVVSKLLTMVDKFTITENDISTILTRYKDNGSVKNTYGHMSIGDVEKIIRLF